MSKVKNILFILRLAKVNSLQQNLSIVKIHFFLPLLMDILPFYLKIHKFISRAKRDSFVNREINSLRLLKGDIVQKGKKRTTLHLEDIGLTKKEITNLSKKSSEILIARIDQDGSFRSDFIESEQIRKIKEHFLARMPNNKNFYSEIVSIDGQIGVKKLYQDNKVAFINEVKALHNFGFAGCNTPKILDIDFENLTLTMEYIPGRTLQEKFIKKNDKVIDDIFYQLTKIHNHGFLWGNVGFEHIIIDELSQKPFLIDFEQSEYIGNLGKNASLLLCDQEIDNFNLLFKTDKLTYKKIKQKIQRKENEFSEIYAPVYFGAGLHIGSLINNISGYGRWHFLLKKTMPNLAEKRILDIGANNCSISIEILRKGGAIEAIGIENDTRFIKQGEYIKAACEWADKKQYNFKYIQADMATLPNMNLGKFDVVLALCCLYYLDTDSSAKIIRYVSTITDVFIVECNIDYPPQGDYSYEMASLEYPINALKTNCFTDIKVFAPPGYSRPIIVASKKTALP